MKYKNGDKLQLKNEDILIDVVNLYPGAQMNSIPTNNENMYGVTLNGHKAILSENVLDVLTKELKLEIEPIIEPEMIVEEKPKATKKKVAKKRKS